MLRLYKTSAALQLKLQWIYMLRLHKTFAAQQLDVSASVRRRQVLYEMERIHNNMHN